MAHFQTKAGGPIRGRRRVKKMGMGSGKSVTRSQRAKPKGKRG